MRGVALSIDLVAEFTANFDIQNLADATVTITPRWEMEINLYSLNNAVSCYANGVTEYLNAEWVPYPPGEPSVRAGHTTLLSGCRHGRQNALRHLQHSSVLQVVRNRFCYLNSYESLVNTSHRTA